MINILSYKKSLPTAFVADNDIIALGAISTQRKQYKIPDDVSIVGFDDMPFAQLQIQTLPQ